MEEQQFICDTLKETIDKTLEEMGEITKKVESLPIEVVDIANVIEQVDKKTRDHVTVTSSLFDHENELYKKITVHSKIDKFLSEFDIDEVLERKDKILTLRDGMKVFERDLEQIEKKVATLEDPGFLKGCKCLNEAEEAQREKPYKLDSLKGAEEEVQELNPEEVEEHIGKYSKLSERRSTLSERILKLNLFIEKDKNNIENLKRELQDFHVQKEEYQENKEAIDSLESFLAEKKKKEIDLNLSQDRFSKCQETIMNLYKLHGSYEEKLDTLTSLQEELDELRQEYSAYDLFMRCMHSNGIAYDVIKKRLPAINEEVAKVLANIVDFEVFFEDDGKKLNIFIKHPSYDPRPLEMGSGAEKTIAAMAIRLALLSVSSLPKGDIFILDEPGTALDADNMEGFVRILDVVKSYFKTVLLITHLDSLKDCVDTQITIDKVDGYAFIKQ